MHTCACKHRWGCLGMHTHTHTRMHMHMNMVLAIHTFIFLGVHAYARSTHSVKGALLAPVSPPHSRTPPRHAFHTALCSCAV
jgi:hypothetical protein